jgi:DNA-binding MltR family transcriptional regulator
MTKEQQKAVLELLTLAKDRLFSTDKAANSALARAIDQFIAEVFAAVET